MAKKFTFAVGKEAFEIGVDSWKQLIRWLEKEQSQWAWLIPGEPTDVHNLATNIHSQWKNLLDAVKSCEARNDDLEAARQHLGPLEANGPLLTSTSQDGRTVLDITKTAGHVPAAYAYGFLKGQVSISQASNPDGLLGCILASMPNLSNVAEIEQRLKAERQIYSSSLRKQSSKLDEEIDARIRQFEELLSRGKKLGLRTLRKRRDMFNDAAQDWQQIADKAVSDINQTRETYSQYMELEAPVDYWSKKAKDHGDKAQIAAQRLAIFLVIFTIVMGVSFYSAAQLILSDAGTLSAGNLKHQPPTAIYFLVSAALAILSTVGFWIGRIFSKLYLSEHHLQTDAEERAVMTKTYLALTENQAAQESDKQIILSALFRSTQDGIVRDEGAPEIGLQSLISKLMTQGKA